MGGGDAIVNGDDKPICKRRADQEQAGGNCYGQSQNKTTKRLFGCLHIVDQLF